MDVLVLRRRRVGVFWGGPSSERIVSAKSRAAVQASLTRLGVNHVALDLTPHVCERIRQEKINLAFLVTHGAFGEDGRLQGLLDILKIPYTGSGVLASALAMHKPSAKQLFASAGLPTPKWVVLRKGEKWAGFSGPLVVKPASQGSAVGVCMVRKGSGLREALTKTWVFDKEALVEKRVVGTEITVGVYDGQSWPVVEIVPKHEFYDFHSKYTKGGSRHVVPARISARSTVLAQELAVKAHNVLGCRHMSRVDMIVDKTGQPTILEVNTLPGLTPTSLFPDAAKAAGMDFDALVVGLLTMALRNS